MDDEKRSHVLNLLYVLCWIWILVFIALGIVGVIDLRVETGCAINDYILNMLLFSK